MFWKRIVAGPSERVVVAKNGRFHQILLPGAHFIWVAPGVCLEIERHATDEMVFRSRWADSLIRERADLAERYFIQVATNSVQLAMVYVDGKLFTVLTPAKRILFWRGGAEIRAEIVDVIADLPSDSDPDSEIEQAMLAALEPKFP